jgi:hypothetical protein
MWFTSTAGNSIGRLFIEPTSPFRCPYRQQER